MGTEAAHIVVDKYGGDKFPRINGGGKSENSNTLLLNHLSYWDIRNLEITNTVSRGLSHAATGIRVSGGVYGKDSTYGNITIAHCHVHDVNSASVYERNYQKGTGGIILEGTLKNMLVENCHIANCSV